MKKIFILMCLVIILPSCRVMYYQASHKAHPTKQDNKCVELQKPLALWKGSKVDSFQRKFLTDGGLEAESFRNKSGRKKVDIIEAGTKFRVHKIYEKYRHATPSGWFLRVNLLFADGKYQGEMAEISGMFDRHPHPWLYSYDSQTEGFHYSKELNADSLELNSEFFKDCEN